MVVDYPNSKKARKVFLVLFVGGGGPSQQVPEGLQGEEQQEEGKVQFERRRERENRRVKSGKKKGLKDKDWILKKKEASNSYCLFNDAQPDQRNTFSYIVSEGRRVSLEIPNSHLAKDGRYFD